MRKPILLPGFFYKIMGLSPPTLPVQDATITSLENVSIIDKNQEQIIDKEEMITPFNTKRLDNLMNIEAAFKKTRLIALCAMAFALIFSIIVMLVAMQMVTKGKGSIYVTNGFGETVLAEQIAANQNRQAEANAQVRNFHSILYNITPNPDAIKENLEKVLLMGDGSIKAFLDKRGDSYYKKLIASDIEVKYQYDSIQINTAVYPYKSVQFGQEIIQSNVGFITKNLVTTCELKEVARTDANPHGLLISNFNVLKNERLDFVEFKKK